MVFSGANAKVHHDRNGLFVIGAKARLFLSFRRFRVDAIRFTGARGGMDSG
ncbi:hypothetical protein VVMO6_03433 [Vibrio vulnificus MO6-24/O]|nr:hypothetical protein VVMO6_03433 [Vibrio vulnificus MO6-24/O]